MDSQYAADLAAGEEFQDYIVHKWARELGIPLSNYTSAKWQKQRGENPQGVEIKFDRRFRDTSNLFIETMCRPSGTGDFYPGGIYSGQHWLYIIGDEKTQWTFATRWLLELHKTTRYTFYEGDTMKGFLLPLPDADKYCVRKDDGR